MTKDSFFKDSTNDIIERLDLIDKNFANILHLECHDGLLTDLLTKHYRKSIIVSTNPYQLNYNEEAFFDKHPSLFANFDLIIFTLGLHWIDEVQSFLAQIKLMLKPDGIFIGNFLGGNSLKALRRKFIEAEIATNRPHFQHISPFIHFDHVAPLLSQAGFAEIIVDYEIIQLNYKSPLDCIRELKNIGKPMGRLLACQNAKYNTHYTISKQMLAILNDDTNIFTEEINIISFISSPNKNSIKL